MIVKEWLKIPEQDLPLKLAEALVKGPWEHDCTGEPFCIKCSGEDRFERMIDLSQDCPVPDPIKIDWNTAMKWRDKIVSSYGADEMWCELENVLYQEGWYDKSDVAMVTIADPRHYLIAAAMAAGAKA